MAEYIQMTASSLHELSIACSALNGKMRFRPWYRGHADDSWHLDSMIHRPGMPTRYEGAMAATFILDAPGIHAKCPPVGNKFSWLALARHHGLPTRLLDWTQSPLIAAFFAVDDEPYDTNADVWALDARSLNKTQVGLDDHLSAFSEVAIDCANSAFDRSPYEPVVGVIPQLVDPHMTAQQARFTIHGVSTPIEELSGSENFVARIRIPEKSRDRIRKELYIFGIKRQVLFPSLTGLAHGIHHDWTWGIGDDEEIQ